MYKTFKFRLDPNKSQQEMLDRTFNATRFVWNYFLCMRKQEYLYESEKVNYYECCRQLTEMKKDPSFEWLKCIDILALQSELQFLDDAFVRYFKHQSEYPKYKSKKYARNTYTTKCQNNGIRILDDKKHVRLPKYGAIRIRRSRDVEGKIIQATISKSKVGKYYISIVCKIDDVDKVPIKEKVGIDLGVRTYATLSNGQTIQSSYSSDWDIINLERRQSKLDRKPRESNRKTKQRIIVAKTYERIANKRKDFQHKASSKIVNSFDLIAAEDIDIKSLREQSNKNLRAKIGDCSWFNFVRMMQYKADLYGKTFIQIDRFFPSSKTCHKCGNVNKELRLSDAEWICPSCRSLLQRDVNAAINILNIATE